MRMQLKHLSLGVLLVGLSACSSKDHQETNTVDPQQEEIAVNLDSINVASTVIVPKEKLNADQHWDEIDQSVLYPHPAIPYPRLREAIGPFQDSSSAPDFLVVVDYSDIESVLKLNQNQLFVIGDENREIEENNVLLNLTNDEYFKYANNLAINYVRYLKSVRVEPKQEFEKSQDYEKRVSQANQDAENRAIDYDAELLQRSLNNSVQVTSFATMDRNYQYDADLEQLSLNFRQYNRYQSAVIDSKLVFKIPPQLAKTLIDKLSQARMGYVFNIDNNQLNLEGVFFYFKGISKADRRGDAVEMVVNATPVLKLISFKQKSVIQDFSNHIDIIGDVDAAPFIDVLASPVWKFKFGLENYLSPETLLKKYPPQPALTYSESESEF